MGEFYLIFEAGKQAKDLFFFFSLRKLVSNPAEEKKTKQNKKILSNQTN